MLFGFSGFICQLGLVLGLDLLQMPTNQLLDSEDREIDLVRLGSAMSKLGESGSNLRGKHT